MGWSSEAAWWTGTGWRDVLLLLLRLVGAVNQPPPDLPASLSMTGIALGW